VRGFKSLLDVNVSFPRLTVLFGPNSSGKSNLLDAIQALSRIGTHRTISDALADPIRGYPIEAFSFPKAGLAEILGSREAAFSLEADLHDGRDAHRYRVGVQIQPGSGSLSVRDEYLALLSKKGEPRGNPSIEVVDNKLRIRRKSRPAHPRYEDLGLNHSLLSDPRLGGVEYRAIERCRSELSAWRTYYLDPRVAMRTARPPADVTDIGVLGEDIAPYLFKLAAEKPKNFGAVKRALRSIIPSVEELSVDLDKRRGTLDVQIRQAGTEFSSRIISEGTLRVLALCSIAVNPWSGSLLAFEEPENGVHPRRIELIARLFTTMASSDARQLVVTTHSPLFCDAVLRESQESPEEVSLLSVKRGASGTEVTPFRTLGPLFDAGQIGTALDNSSEDGLFESLMMRGLLGE
jgi:predicted ATPase